MTIKYKISIPKSIIFSLVWILVIGMIYEQINQLEFKKIIDSIASQNNLLSISSFIFFFASAYILRAIRFGILTRHIANISWKDILVSFPKLFMLGAISPFRIGEAYRAVWIRNYADVSGKSLSMWIGERMLDLIVLLLSFSFFLRDAELLPQDLYNSLTFLSIAIITVYLLIWVAHDWIARALEARFPFLKLNRILQGFQFMNNHKLHVQTLLLTVLIWSSMATAFYLYFYLLPSKEPVSFEATTTLLASVNLSSIIALTPSNIGGYQAVFLAVSPLFQQIEANKIFASAVIIQSCGLFIIFVAVPIASATRIKFSESTSSRLYEPKNHS